MRVLLAAITVGLAVVISAPFALSSQDLVDWAQAASGLGLPYGWALFVFVALDLAAAVCVCMTVYAAWRGESAGAFGMLVWVFAGISAYANHTHAVTTLAADDDWFYPAMSIMGPVLLEVTVRRVRRWVRTSAGRFEPPLPHFRFARWLPGVAFRETLGSLVLAVTEGYSRPEDAVAAYRSRRDPPPLIEPEQPPPFRRPERLGARDVDLLMIELFGRMIPTPAADDTDQPVPPADPPITSRTDDVTAPSDPIGPADHVDPDPIGDPDPIDPPPDPPDPPSGDRRKKVTPAALATAQAAYNRARTQEDRELTDAELAPLLGVSIPSARRLRGKVLRPEYARTHSPFKSVPTAG
jgi:hypothetical protein